MRNSRKIELERCPISQVHLFLQKCFIIKLGAELVMSQRQAADSIVPFKIGSLKIGCVENENDRPHVFVDITAANDHAKLIENPPRNGALIATITPKIKSLRFRKRKNAVVHLIFVGKFDPSANAYGK